MALTTMDGLPAQWFDKTDPTCFNNFEIIASS